MIYPIKIQNSSFKEAQWNTQKTERLMILATQYMNKRCLSEKNHKKNQTKNRAELPGIYLKEMKLLYERDMAMPVGLVVSDYLRPFRL